MTEPTMITGSGSPTNHAKLPARFSRGRCSSAFRGREMNVPVDPGEAERDGIESIPTVPSTTSRGPRHLC